MNRRVGATIFLTLLLLIACSGGTSSVTQSQTASTGVLSGHAARGPVSPVGIPGVPNAANAVGVRIVATGPGGLAAGSATTDGGGDYRMALPAGTYQVTVENLRPGEFVKDLPDGVTIRAGAETRLDILVDTGIR